MKNFLKNSAITPIFPNGFFAVFIIFLTFFSPFKTFAAELSATTTSTNFSVGQDFLIEAMLDTKNESVNTVHAVLQFPSDSFDLKELRNGNSQVNFWVEEPRLTAPGEISFSGITPGGLMGQNILLFSAV